MEFKLKTTTPIKDQVYRQIRKSIMQFHYIPGQPLSEKLISLELGVSRSPVREAFIVLAQEGLVEVFSQKGTYVSFIKLQTIRESQFIRGLLEVGIVRQLALHIDEQGLAKLQRILENQRRYQAEGNPGKFYEEDELFHRTLAELSGFPTCWGVVQAVKLQIDRVRYLSLPIEGRIESLIRQHQAILEAIVRKDPDLAQEKMRYHLDEVHDIIAVLSETYSHYFKE